MASRYVSNSQIERIVKDIDERMTDKLAPGKLGKKGFIMGAIQKEVGKERVSYVLESDVIREKYGQYFI